MLRNCQCEVLSCEENGLTFHLSLSLAFDIFCSPASDYVRCIRTTARSMWTIDRVKYGLCIQGVKIKEAFYSIEFWMMFNIVSRSMPSSTEREYEKSCVVRVAR